MLSVSQVSLSVRSFTSKSGQTFCAELQLHVFLTPKVKLADVAILLTRTTIWKSYVNRSQVENVTGCII